MTIETEVLSGVSLVKLVETESTFMTELGFGRVEMQTELAGLENVTTTMTEMTESVAVFEANKVVSEPAVVTGIKPEITETLSGLSLETKKRLAVAVSALSVTALACSQEEFMFGATGAGLFGALAGSAFGTNFKQKASVGAIGAVIGGFAGLGLREGLEAGLALLGVDPGFCLGVAGLFVLMTFIRFGIFKGKRF